MSRIVELRAFGTQAALDAEWREFIDDLDEFPLQAYTGFQSKTFKRTKRTVVWKVLEDRDACHKQISGGVYSQVCLHVSLKLEVVEYIMSRVRDIPDQSTD